MLPIAGEFLLIPSTRDRAEKYTPKTTADELDG
jgi:hypothetical protein